MDRALPPPGRRVRPFFTIRGALVAGFAVVFGLWVFSAYELLRTLRNVETRAAVVTDVFVGGEQMLSAIRTAVLLGSVTLRDSLIDPSAATRESAREDQRQLRADTDRRMAEYIPEVPVDERQQWVRLQATVTDYWQSLESVMGPEAPATLEERAALLRRRLPRRQEILGIIDTLSALHGAARQQQRDEIARLYAEARSRFVSTVSAGVLLGVLVALAAARHVVRLEAEIQRQHASEEQNRRDLERLSARLVDVQEQERRTLARELHDEVGQALTAIKMEIGVALRTQSEPRATSSLQEARALAESTLQNVRDLSQLLHPSMLDDFGLRETLSAYLQSFTKRTGIRGDFTHDGLETRLPTDVEVCVYRVSQEALTNIARHSGARVCSIALTRRNNMLSLLIEDDGRGVAAVRETAMRHGLGVIGMRERAQSLGGDFAIEERTGGGTRITMTLPVPDSEPVAQPLAG